MKTNPRIFLPVLLALLSLAAARAQQDMETSVPANWAAGTGTLSISGDHYKLGVQSLRWDWAGGDVITVSSPGIAAADVTDAAKNTCDLWVWNGTALPGQKVRIEVMNGATAQYWSSPSTTPASGAPLPPPRCASPRNMVSPWMCSCKVAPRLKRGA